MGTIRMDNSKIAFKSIIPIGGKVLTMYKSVISFLVLYINGKNQLCLSRLSNAMSVLFTVKVANFVKTYLQNSNFALSEDQRGFIHIVLPYTTGVIPQIPQNMLEKITLTEDFNTLILKLSNDGEIIDIGADSNLSNYNLVNIKGLTWMFSNSGNNIQIRNLTIGGMISYIIASDVVIISSVYYFNNKVFITGIARGDISYHDISITLPKCAYLLILDITASEDIHGGSNGAAEPKDRKWKIFDYFYGTYNDNCEDESCESVIAFSSFRISNGNYIIAGYTNASNIDIYQRKSLMKSFALPGNNILILCKVSIPKLKVSLIHHQFDFTFGQRIFLNLKQDLILLSGYSKNSTLIDIIRGKVSSHINKYNFLISFDGNLKALSSIFFGSGRLNYRITRACGCNDCPGDNNARYNPNRIMRMFLPGATSTAGMGIGCTGTTGGITFSGSTCNLDSKTGFNTSPGCVFTSYFGNYHCLPAPSYSDEYTAPGDLYNTKYKGYSSLAVTTTLEMVDSQNGPSYSNQTVTVDEATGDVYSSTNLIENLVVDDQVTTPLYSNYNTGYLVNFM